MSAAPHEARPGAARTAARPARSEGEDARTRLMHSGLRLFALQGYAKTSTRELAEDAGVNVAAISYYFGDKAGLYRAVFEEPPGLPCAVDVEFDAPGRALDEALARFYAAFLEPLKQGDTVRLCMKLHFREMLEPTGLWAEDAALRGLRPPHEALLRVLLRHFGLDRADDELRRLALCIGALGVHLHVGREVIAGLAPGLDDGAASLDRWSERLVMYALAMVDAERRRRGIAPAGSGAPR